MHTLYSTNDDRWLRLTSMVRYCRHTWYTLRTATYNATQHACRMRRRTAPYRTQCERGFTHRQLARPTCRTTDNTHARHVKNSKLINQQPIWRLTITTMTSYCQWYNQQQRGPAHSVTSTLQHRQQPTTCLWLNDTKHQSLAIDTADLKQCLIDTWSSIPHSQWQNQWWEQVTTTALTVTSLLFSCK